MGFENVHIITFTLILFICNRVMVISNNNSKRPGQGGYHSPFSMVSHIIRVQSNGCAARLVGVEALTHPIMNPKKKSQCDDVVADINSSWEKVLNLNDVNSAGYKLYFIFGKFNFAFYK